jgi:ABC-type transport system involved in multi-copper enzyme maturation permease subunit
MSTLYHLLLVIGLLLLQAIAAIPWLLVVTKRSLTTSIAFLTKVVAGVVGVGLLGRLLIYFVGSGDLIFIGRVYCAVLTLQVAIDFFVLAFYLMLTFTPKTGAVALAAFQEGTRQPLFWLITSLGAMFMVVSIVIPYFTFGEDLKMVKELTYALTMLAPAFFGVISASISVAEEIEGRTAVTLLSKPVTRRSFLIGKFIGITLASLMMTTLMGWVLVWVVLAKTHYDYVPGITNLPPDPPWLGAFLDDAFGRGVSADLLRGSGLWLRDSMEALPGLIIGFGQVMTLIAVSVALATRVPMVVNMAMCLVVYILGHLTPIMVEVSQDIQLVRFFAQLFELLLPGLDLFDVGTAVVRDVPLDPGRYWLYTLNVAIYALIYTAIANMAGLILFEDKDVA